MRRWLRDPVLALLVSAASTARAADNGGTQSPFVLGAGARALGMGRAAVALTNDANALFWNPARLAETQQTELSLFRTELFIDDNVYHAGFFSYPTLDLGTFGIGFQKLDVAGIERRDDRNQLTGTFDAGESSLLLGYGRHVGPFLGLGGALRVVQQGVDATSAVSVGLNLGVALERRFGAAEVHRLSAAATLQNAVEPHLRLDQDTAPDPRSLALGLAYVVRPAASRFAWAAAADLNLPNTADARLGLGAEMEYCRVLALRTGLDDGHATFGLGVSWHDIALDYALRADDALSRNDRFTLAVRLGHALGERRVEREQQRERQVSEQLDQRLERREADERTRARADADSAFTAGHSDEAARLYRRVLALDPDDAIANDRIQTLEKRQAQAAAAHLLQSGEAGQAAAAYQAIEERWPGDAITHAGLATARTRLQQSADRDRQLNGVFKQALAHFADGDFAAADAALVELLRLAPNHELGLELRQRLQTARRAAGDQELAQARDFVSRGDFDTALAHLAIARRHLGENPELLALATQWTQAKAAARRAAATPVAVVGPGAESTAPPVPALRRRKHDAKLSAEARRELDHHFQDGLAAFRGGDFERATRHWNSVWVEDPGYEKVGEYLVKAYLYEGIALYGDGKYDAAIDRCKRVLEIDPTNAKALRYVDRIREEQTELRAIQDLK